MIHCCAVEGFKQRSGGGGKASQICDFIFPSSQRRRRRNLGLSDLSILRLPDKIWEVFAENMISFVFPDRHDKFSSQIDMMCKSWNFPCQCQIWLCWWCQIWDLTWGISTPGCGIYVAKSSNSVTGMALSVLFFRFSATVNSRKYENNTETNTRCCPSLCYFQIQHYWPECERWK